MRFLRLYLMAWVRGLFYRWPHQPGVPSGYRGVSCGLRTFGEVRGMYREGWEPWAFQRTRTRGLGVSRVFRVPMTEEEKEYERISTEIYLQMADEHDAEEARRAQEA